MDFGVHLPHMGREASGPVLRKFASELERLDVHSAWVSDHVCWPASLESQYPYSDDGSFPAPNDLAWLDPISTLTYIAACTERLRLGTSVLILPYRLPVVTAKQLATLDVVSDGRLILGAGVGWMAEEAAVLGMPWEQRGKRSDEQLEIFRRLFSDDEPSFDGEFYQFGPVRFEPKPVQTPVPVWVGGATPAAFARVARSGQGFHAAFQPLETVAEEWTAVQRACEKIGRDASGLTLSLRVFLDPESGMENAKSLAGSKDAMLERLGDMRDIGISHVLLDPVAGGGVEGRLYAVQQFMEDVAPDCR
jgi:probable F420-dependent oxidoreductase